jgi:hypothetical protein
MSALRRLPDLLSWTGGDSLRDDLERVLVAAVSEGLAALRRRLEEADPRLAATLGEELAQLPDDALVRIVTAPQVYYRVAHDRRGDPVLAARFLLDCVEAEHRRLDRERPLRHDVWTCLGDHLYRASPSAPGYDAPRLPQGLAVDYVSPFARGPLPEVSGTAAEIGAERASLIMAKVERAFSALDAAAPEAHAFVLRLSKVLVVRVDEGGDGHYTAASTRTAIGRPILRNPHRADVGIEEIADGVVHETIHAAIDLIELERPIVCDTAALDHRCRSLWTGRSLDLNTYVQACFVWCGLWHLWLGALGADGFDARQVFRLMRLACRGFAAGDVTEQLSPVADQLDPDLAPALDDAQRRVLSGLRIVEGAYADVA